MEDIASKCERSALYKFLSLCYCVPDGEMLTILRDLSESADEPYSELAGMVPGEDALRVLKIDHSRLFVGPFRLLAPPYGSVYLEGDGRLAAVSAVDVGRRFRQEGLELAIKEAPDHITAELEFMHFLISREIEATNRSDDVTASRYSRKRRSFVETHLGRWVSDFAANVRANAETEFYKTVALVTESLVSGECAPTRQ